MFQFDTYLEFHYTNNCNTFQIELHLHLQQKYLQHIII